MHTLKIPCEINITKKKKVNNYNVKMHYISHNK